jgi:hypothetical protein
MDRREFISSGAACAAQARPKDVLVVANKS